MRRGHKDWSQWLDDMLWVYKTTFKMSICGILLTYLLQGMQLPLKVQHIIFWILKKLNFDIAKAREER